MFTSQISRDEVRSAIEDKLCAHFAVTAKTATDDQVFQASAIVIREIMSRLLAVEETRCPDREVHYLSMEFLMGRSLMKNAFNLGIANALTGALEDLGRNASDIFEAENDAGLGNGGLGRLAACYMDSLATLGIPATGYSLCYELGIFRQKIVDGKQTEVADDWRSAAESWLVARNDEAVEVRFGGTISPRWDSFGRYHAEHTGYQTVTAVPRDMLIAGYGGNEVNILRLWDARSTSALDMYLFSEGEYVKSLEQRTMSEVITKVLYPADDHIEGKTLRLKQQYFFLSATAQSIIKTHIKRFGDIKSFSKHHRIQINDTHPALVIPELMRIMMDEYGLGWDEAWDQVSRSVAYTNHTVMGEALERWDMDLLRSVVPEICDILLKIEERLQQEFPGANLHVVCDNQARMADLSVYMSRKVNGVAEIHSQILRDDLFRAWNEKYPGRIVNVTNGITPRRWLGLCNPELTELIRAEIGEGFLRDLDRIGYLREHVSDELAMLFNAVKLQKKSQLAAHIRAAEGVDIPEEFVFDVQVKRAHEYKRQLMNALCLADFYFEIKNGGLADMPPTAFIFGAKAAPGYRRAKAVIRYINRFAELVNNDPDVNGKMRIVFVQNYNCSYAEKIIPAADISEQISPAGTEASGTGNMKLMLNGAVTLGTMDGANVEIVERAGLENNYIFGASVEEINRVRDTYNARDLYNSNANLRRAVDTLVNGTVPTDAGQQELYTALLDGASWHRPDHYFSLYDFQSYQDTRLRANRDYRDRVEFGRKCLMNVASAGYFSSDRTIRQYAKEIWKI